MERIVATNPEELDPDFIKSEGEIPTEETGGEGNDTETKEEVKVPEGMMDTVKLAESLQPEDLKKIHDWYSAAMDRRDREPLEYGSFYYHFFEGGSWEPTYAVGDMEKGFVFGFYKHDIFIPTHFAPKTLRGGYSIFKELAENKELAVATAITDDLAKTLLKMEGWHKLKIGFLAYFNSELKKKTVVYNSAEGIRTKLIGLMKEFWEETNRLKKEQQETENTADATNIESR